MRIAFISDLHSNLQALENVLGDAEARGVDEIICLGDIVDLGPEPGEVVNVLRDRNIFSVRGNHDTLDENPELEFLRDVESWTREKLSADQLEWLEKMCHLVQLSKSSRPGYFWSTVRLAPIPKG